jgi:hypothetical protein
MNKYILILLITWFARCDLHAQYQQVRVKIAPFSTRSNDEFSPVFFEDGIVFCSNQSNENLVSYKNGQNALYKIYYVANKDSKRWERPKILAKELTTDYNDGPVTFNAQGNIMYFSRNNFIGTFLKNISDTLNKVGIYSAEFINGKWTNIQPFTYNDPLYSFGTPAITSDGKRIYFSSDMPGGYGGIDLYYCDKGTNNWSKPVNMGPAINTPKNESFPFASKCGKLFFASDGHKGLGGKDLFYTQEMNGTWIDPVHLDSAINSPADDFGLVTDSTFESGYFSSNRRKTDDIFSFSLTPIKFINCDSLTENNYCFTFDDEQYQFSDTAQVIYQWDFGDGLQHVGKEVKYCFPGPGNYTVKLSIIDARTGKTISNQVSYDVALEAIEQVYINSCNVGIVGKPISFDGLKTNLKNFKPTDYFWNFGEGYKPGGPSMNWTFVKKGEYDVQLGLLSEKDSLGRIYNKCITKKIRIYDTFQELSLKDENPESRKAEKADSVDEQIKTMSCRIYFMDDLREDQKTNIRKSLPDLKKCLVSFNAYGISPLSYSFLDVISDILKNNLDIRLNLVLHMTENTTTVHPVELSEKWARELNFFFKNKGIDMNTFHCGNTNFSLSDLNSIKPHTKTVDGIIEFIFMKK